MEVVCLADVHHKLSDAMMPSWVHFDKGETGQVLTLRATSNLPLRNSVWAL